MFYSFGFSYVEFKVFGDGCGLILCTLVSFMGF